LMLWLQQPPTSLRPDARADVNFANDKRSGCPETSPCAHYEKNKQERTFPEE
jgi:hypothetical protein